MRFQHEVTCEILFPSSSGGRGRSAQPCLEADPLDADPPGHVTCDAYWEASQPPFCGQTQGMTHACENITLPEN